MPYLPGQALDAAAALNGYTVWAAAVAGEEGHGGRLRPGLRADVTALAADPLETPPDELPEVPVQLTVVDGELVYEGD